MKRQGSTVSDLELIAILKRKQNSKEYQGIPILQHLLSPLRTKSRIETSESQVTNKKYFKVEVNNNNSKKTKGLPNRQIVIEKYNMNNSSNRILPPRQNILSPSSSFNNSQYYSNNDIEQNSKAKSNFYGQGYNYQMHKNSSQMPLVSSQSQYLTDYSFSPIHSSNGNYRKQSVDYINLSHKNLANMNNMLSVNPEEIIQLEEKINCIVSFITRGKEATIPCCDWWSFYIVSSLLKHQEYYFQDRLSKIIINSSSSLMMFAVLLCYDISDEAELYHRLQFLFKSIFTLIQLNSLLIFKFIFSQLNLQDKLISEFNDYLKEKLNGESKIDMNEDIICNIIRHNCTSIVDLLLLILNNYTESAVYNQLMFFFHNISKIQPEELNKFFINCVYLPGKHEIRSLTTRMSHRNKGEIEIIKAPYLPSKKNNKPLYTLILDLDETLINFAKSSNDTSKGVLIYRPGLIEFLSIIKDYYELVLFTTATQEYADPIINTIENNHAFFDYRLYRNHCSLINNERVKDLSKLGRDLNKMIIVDNLADNYSLQKTNGILITPFYGDEQSDKTLYNLTVLLVQFAKEAKETNENDLRKLIVKYHNDITVKISSNLYKSKLKNPVTIECNGQNSK